MRALLRSLARRNEGELSLRAYTEADLPRLYALDRSCFPPGIAYSRAELRSFLEHPSSFTVLACRGQSILGFAIARPARRHAPQTGHALHILTIDVSPNARREGIGRKLMHWILAKAGELGSETIALEVAVDNLSAQLFYARFRFEVKGTIPGYYNGVLDALVMELEVASAS